MYDTPEPPAMEAGMKSANRQDRAFAMAQMNEMTGFHKKRLCSARGDPGMPACAPREAFAPEQVDDSRKFLAVKMARNSTRW